MKILLVTARFPIPAQTGDKLRALRLIEHLAPKHEVHLICLQDGPPVATDRQTLESKLASLHVIDHGIVTMARNLVSGALSKLPVQTLIYQSPELAARVTEVIAAHDIEVVVSQLARISPNVDPGDAAYVVDFVDALSLGFSRRGEAKPFPLRRLFQVESQRMERLEVVEGQRADRRVVTSGVDKTHLEALGTGGVDVVPVGVSDDFADSEEAVTAPKRDIDVVFTGNLGYAANIEAAEFLVNEVLPTLLAKRPNLRVTLAGARPARRVRRLASENVEVVGPVRDLRTYLRRAQVAVAPMVTGSGIQLKLLEAMAMGVPVVTTSLAGEPINAAPGDAFLVGDNATQFATSIEQLLDSPEERNRVGENGRQLVQERFRWLHVNSQYETLLSDAVDQTKRS